MKKICQVYTFGYLYFIDSVGTTALKLGHLGSTSEVKWLRKVNCFPIGWGWINLTNQRLTLPYKMKYKQQGHS